MAQLILKSPYIKGGARAVNYAKYIGTRERVELVPDGRPATKKQEQLITSLVKDFPDAKNCRSTVTTITVSLKSTPPRSSRRRWRITGLTFSKVKSMRSTSPHVPE